MKHTDAPSTNPISKFGMSTPAPLTVEVKKVIAASALILREAQTYKVTNAVDYAEAGEVLKRIKSQQKKLDEEELKITRPINAGLKALRDLFRGPKALAAEAELLVKRAMLAYSDEQDRLRRIEQTKADELARKAREKLEAQADKAAVSGKFAKSEQLQERAEMTVAPIVERAPEKISGVSFHKVWKFEVVDEFQVPRDYCSSDSAKIRAVVIACKGDTVIPGVRVYEEKTIASGGVSNRLDTGR
jgi:hypothetical protein